MSVPSNLIPRRLSETPEYTGADDTGYSPYLVNGVMHKVAFRYLAEAGGASLAYAWAEGSPPGRSSAKYWSQQASGSATLANGFRQRALPMRRTLSARRRNTHSGARSGRARIICL